MTIRSDGRAERIESILTNVFSPDYLLVKDQSHLHAGHAGARSGGGHFDISIRAEAFRDCSRVQSHRLIYDALGDLMTAEIHALSIHAGVSSPDLSG